MVCKFARPAVVYAWDGIGEGKNGPAMSGSLADIGRVARAVRRNVGATHSMTEGDGNAKGVDP